MNVKVIAIILTVLILSGLVAYKKSNRLSSENVAINFEECVAFGNPVLESWPEQCIHNGQNFVRDIGNEMEKFELIRIHSPRPTAIISSPLVIEGEARGYWFFEADFPIVLLDSDNNILVESFATADGSWMTEEFVPFNAEVLFESQLSGSRGTLLLKHSNASGLPERDDELRVPIVFE